MSVHHGYWTSRLSNYAIQGLNARPLNPRVFSSAALCVSAARTSIHLIKYIPQGDFACVWLILYFPVSSLVTLFANILQNPQDPRARADVKLMNLVVNFLSLLATDEGNGSVKRMLNVCSEFERIAKVVLDKSERESHSRRKRKTTEDKAAADSQVDQQTPTATRKFSAATAATKVSPATGSASSQPFNPAVGSVYSPSPTLANGDLPLMPDYNGDFSDILQANGFNPQYGDASSMPTSMASPLNLTTFQQPFVPQDLWQMPMTLEWDWADITNPNVPFDPNDPAMMH